jgi:hypothetical protein
MESTRTSRPTLPPRASESYAALAHTDLQAAGQASRSWLWHGYLAAGEVTLLTSQWETGKSTLISVLLARLKTGGTLAGLPLRPGKAVVVSEESPLTWYERSQVLAFDNHVRWFCRPFRGKPRPPEWLALLEQITRLHEQRGLDLVVLDALAKLSPLKSENDAGEMLSALLPLQRLTARGFCVLVAHHPRKGAVVPGQAARGSGALSGYVDIIIEMQRLTWRSAKDRRRRLRAYSRHEATPPRWVIELAPDGTDYRALGASAEPDFEHGWPLLQCFLKNAEGPPDAGGAAARLARRRHAAGRAHAVEMAGPRRQGGVGAARRRGGHAGPVPLPAARHGREVASEVRGVLHGPAR